MAEEVMLRLICLLHAIVALSMVLSILDGDEDAVQCALGGVTFGIGIGAAGVPHILMMVVDLLTEFSVDGKGAKDCGL